MEAITLFELNNMVREVVEMSFTNHYWVRAELSEVRTSLKGHCFIELIDKDDASNTITAKAKGVIMRNIFPLLRLNFEQVTGQPFTAGLKVLLQVSVSFSEQYGFSLIVHNIDANYTIGSMAQRRKEILLRLENEGVANMNQDLYLPKIIQRIAIISSPTAAGYEDFCNQLENNTLRLQFLHKLFPAIMQGENTESSIISALESIACELDDWDVVVIIRGGGAVSDLTSFDTYPLANNCAQFPLPILTGIGHERDLCVLDMVAYSHFKTPTAVAAFLIDYQRKQYEEILAFEQYLEEVKEQLITTQNNHLQLLINRLELLVNNYIPTQQTLLNAKLYQLQQAAQHMVKYSQMQLEAKEQTLQLKTNQKIEQAESHLNMLQNIINAYHPQRILDMGYSMTMKDGKTIQSIQHLHKGDVITTRLKDGEIQSTIN